MASEIDINQLHSFFELSPELMAVLSEDGSFEEANPAWQKNLGWTRRELKGLPFFDFLHPEDLSQAQLEIQKLQQGATQGGFSARFRDKGKAHRWVRWTCHFLKEERHFYLAGRDITELKEAEKELEESKAKSKRLGESAREGIAIHDKGIIVEANQALASMMGFHHPEELIGLDGFQFPAPEYRPLARENAAKGYDQSYEAVFQRRDGTRFDGLVFGKPIQYQGRAMRVTTFLDITALKKREQELLESQDLFRKLTEASRDGIAVSERGKILFANQSLARMLGCEVSEMVGHNAVEFTAPEFREALLKKVMEEVETPYEVIALRKDGTRLPVEISPRMTTYQGRRVRVAFFHDITLRKKIEEEVLRQKEFSLNLLNSSIDGLLAFDRDCRYTLWNPAMERISGHSREEVLGQVAFDVFPFLKQIGEDAHFYSALEGKTSSTQERPYRTPAGRHGFFEAYYMPIKNTAGEILGGLGVIRDVTEKIKTQEAFRESEMNLKAVFHNTFQNIILMDREGRIKAFNPNAEAFILDTSGKKLEAGRGFVDYLHPENAEFFRKSVKKVLGGEAVQVEQSHPSDDGEFHWFEVSYHPVFGASGEIEGVCLTALDIDERKKVQEALRKSEADLRAVFNSSARAFILVGRNGKIQDFNQMAEEGIQRIRGQELEAGRPLADYVEPEHVKAFKERFKKALKGETVHLERVVKSPSGKGEWFEFHYTPVWDVQNKVIGVCVATGSIDERRKAEEALQKSESNLRAIFNSSSQGLTVVNREGVIQYFNRAAADFTRQFMGKNLEIGRSMAEGLTPAARESFLDKLGATLKGEVVRGEGQYRFQDGSRRWFEYTYHPVLDENGAVIAVCLTSLDIDGRKKAEEALQKSEASLRAIFESSTQAITVVDREGIIQYFNQEAAAFLARAVGKSLEIGKPLVDYVGKEGREGFQKNIERGLKGELVQGENLIPLPDGSRRWFEFAYRPVAGEKGAIAGVCVTSLDIDGRKKAEEALRKSEADLKAVFNSGSQVVVLIDPEGNIQNFNPMAAGMAQRVLGRPLTRGTPFLATLPPGADPELFKARFKAALQGQESQGESCIRSAEGKERWVEVKYQPVHDEDGSVQGVCFSLGFIDERKKAEEAMRESQERLQRFNELTREGILIHENPTVVDVNPALAAMMGYEPGEMRGKSGFDFIAPESRDEARQRMEEGSAAPYEVLALRKDGSTFPVELQGRNYLEKGRNLRALSVRDLTWQKAAERILTESEERYRKLVELLPEAIVVHSGGKILYVNSAGLEMFAATPDQVEGSSLKDFLHSDYREEALLRVQAILASGRPTEWIELRLVRKDGQTFDAETKGTPLIYQGIPSVMTLVRDITERKKAETALRESEKDYRRLVAEIPLAMVVNGEDGVIISANSAAARLFRAAKSEDLVGKSAMDFTLPENKGIVKGRMRKTVQEGADAENRETELLTLNGERVQVEIRGIPITLQGKRLVLAILRDVTESKRIHQMLLRYERLAAVGKVIAAIAHEVRNPLAVVSGMSQILKAKLESRSEFHQELETILAQANRLKYFMNDILDYSRNMEIHKAPVSPRTLLEESLILAQAQLGADHVGSLVEWRVEAGLPRFLADAERLQQVMVNLITNAYQALEGAGTITLSALIQDGWMLLGVGDDGPGIAEPDRTKLFEPFFTTKKGGSGLGLTISQKIAEAHGGKITVERLSPHGTLVTLRIPLEKVR